MSAPKITGTTTTTSLDHGKEIFSIRIEKDENCKAMAKKALKGMKITVAPIVIGMSIALGINYQYILGSDKKEFYFLVFLLSGFIFFSISFLISYAIERKEARTKEIYKVYESGICYEKEGWNPYFFSFRKVDTIHIENSEIIMVNKLTKDIRFFKSDWKFPVTELQYQRILEAYNKFCEKNHIDKHDEKYVVEGGGKVFLLFQGLTILIIVTAVFLYCTGYSSNGVLGMLVMILVPALLFFQYLTRRCNYLEITKNYLEFFPFGNKEHVVDCHKITGIVTAKGDFKTLWLDTISILAQEDKPLNISGFYFSNKQLAKIALHLKEVIPLKDVNLDDKLGLFN